MTSENNPDEKERQGKREQRVSEYGAMNVLAYETRKKYCALVCKHNEEVSGKENHVRGDMRDQTQMKGGGKL
ncbi:hypothetical protein E2C01_008991 [Portunus trituberculatus]|uniref:Uncharacterized protein n=1 Tax=Portunus trituberculatus TaxID=210409 RepID=A0A5B7D4A8_PORTR|nr:hypothetical protein [Portunus trituberculatus]